MKGIREQIKDLVKNWDIERLREEMNEIIDSMPTEMLTHAFQDDLELDEDEQEND